MSFTIARPSKDASIVSRMGIKKILLVGSDSPWAIEPIYQKYLRELGVETALFAARSIFFDYYYASLFNKLIFRSGLSTIYQKINQQLLQETDQFRPQVIWVFKGMEIMPGSLVTLRKKGYRLVNYNPDNPFLFSGKGSGNKNITESLNLYDLHFSYNAEIMEQLQAIENTRASYLPFGYDLTDEMLQHSRMQPEIIRCCFLGNPDPIRATLIRQLAEAGIEIDVYGNNWNTFVSHPAVKTFPAVYKDDFWKTLFKYRVQLNIMRVHNLQSHNMRTFEVPGVGGIQLAPDTPEHRAFFVPDQEIFLYRDIQECCVKAKELLSLNAEDAAAIRERALQRCIRSGYSYRNRAEQALLNMNNLVDG